MPFKKVCNACGAAAAAPAISKEDPSTGSKIKYANTFGQRSMASIGLDFGTLSARGVLVDIASGAQIHRVEAVYPHGISALADGGCIMNDARDWLECAEHVLAELVARANEHVYGIGIAFTSCTVLPVDSNGAPMHVALGILDPLSRPHAFPKLWKHHSERVNVLANSLTQVVTNQRGKAALMAYGGRIGLEWFHPKVLEIASEDPDIFDQTSYFLEAGDWLAWKLAGTTGLPLQSTCQACYKALWDSSSDAYVVDSSLLEATGALTRVAPVAWEKLMPGKRSLAAPGTCAGKYRAKIPVGVAMIDAHAAALFMTRGQPNCLALLLGTSGCYMVSSTNAPRAVQGIAGVALHGIAPGLYGIETGSASVGDSFAWLSGITGTPLDELENLALRSLGGKKATVFCLDFFNGNRTPLMRGDLTATFEGISLATTKGELYLAVAEAVAFGVRLVVDLLDEAGVRVDDVVVGGGGLASSRGVCCRLVATALGRRVRICASPGDATARGAAMLGAMAGGGSISALGSSAAGEVAEPIKGEWGSLARYARYCAGVDEKWRTSKI